MKRLSELAITLPHPRDRLLSRCPANSSATACRWRRSPKPKARRSTSTAPRRSASATARSTTPSAATRTRCTTRSRPTRRSRIARLLRELGSAADANSIWEIELARKAGFAPADIVFTGVGKSPAELECAVPLGLKAINVESAGELARVEAIAARLGLAARVARPHQSRHRREEPSAHLDRAQDQQVRRAARRRARAVRDDRRPAVAEAGGGSRARRLADHDASSRCARAAALVAGLVGELQRAGRRARVPRSRRRPRHLLRRQRRCRLAARVRAALVDEVRPTGLPIVIEPGRSIVGPAGVLVARVIDLKPRNARQRVRRHRRRHDRADAAGALRRLSPHRAGARRARAATGSTRSSARSARAATSSAATACCRRSRSATSSRSATPAPTARRWRRTTIAVRCRPKCWSTTARWRVIRRRQTVDDMLALETDSDACRDI